MLARPELRWVRMTCDGIRFALGGCVCCLYVFAGHAWDVAHQAMRTTIVPLPLARDVKFRFFQRYLAGGHLLSVLQRFLTPHDVQRNEALVELLAQIRPVALLFIGFHSDPRHAMLVLGHGLVAEYVASGRAAHVAGLGFRCLRGFVRYLIVTQDPDQQPSWRWPLLARALDFAIGAAEVCAGLCTMRVELAGVRGLLSLIMWKDSCQHVLAHRLSAYESGFFSRRYCQIEEHDAVRNLFLRRNLTWEDARLELAIPLRALAVFYSERNFPRQNIKFPPWAIADIHLSLLGDLAGDLAGGTADDGGGAGAGP